MERGEWKREREGMGKRLAGEGKREEKDIAKSRGIDVVEGCADDSPGARTHRPFTRTGRLTFMISLMKQT